MALRFLSRAGASALLPASQVPSHCNAFLMPGYQHEYFSNDYIAYLTQEISCSGLGICEYRFFSKQRITLDAISDKPLMALAYVQKGNLDGILAGFGPVFLKAGYCYLFYAPNGIKHRASFGKGEYHMIHVNLSPASISNFSVEFKVLRDLVDMMQSGSAKGIMQTAGPYPLEARGFLQLIFAFDVGRGDLNIFLKMSVTVLLYLYFKNILTPDPLRKWARDVDKQERIVKAKDVVDSLSLEKPINIKELSRKVLLNLYTLKRGFRDMFGESIYAYQNKRRLTRAGRLLIETEKSVNEIAREIGYENSSSFSKRFRLTYSLTPMEFRKIYRQ